MNERKSLLAVLTISMLSMVFVTGYSACTPAQRSIAKTADDAATFACQDMLRVEAEKQGFSIEDLCRKKEVLQPFIDALLSAKKQGGAKAGLTAPETPAPDGS